MIVCSAEANSGRAHRQAITASVYVQLDYRMLDIQATCCHTWSLLDGCCFYHTLLIDWGTKGIESANLRQTLMLKGE